MKYRLLVLFTMICGTVSVMAKDDQTTNLTPEDTLTYTILNTISVYNSNYMHLINDGSLLISTGYSDDGEYIDAKGTTGEEDFRTVLRITL